MKRWLAIGTVALVVIGPLFFVGAVIGFMVLTTSLMAAADDGGGGGGTSNPSCVAQVTLDDAETGTTIETSDGSEIALSSVQLNNASALLAGAIKAGASTKAQVIVLMVAFQESMFQNLANSSVPESLELPHDGVGSDGESVGILQAQTKYGWGSLEELMDPSYNGTSFMGGPSGPNAGSPPGLLDISGWESKTPGEAAQAVQGSSHPDAYDKWESAATALLGYMSENASMSCGTASGDAGYPLPEVAGIGDGYGPRACPVYASDGSCAASTWHPALDFVAACGTPVLVARPGTVTVISEYWVTVLTDDGVEVSYLHLEQSSVPHAIGDTVAVGDQIGEVGSTGPSSGCHLDFRVNTLNATDEAVQSLEQATAPGVPGQGYVNPVEYMALYGVEIPV